MQRRTALSIAWIGFTVLLLLHLDFWRPQRVVLYGGFLPEEVAYRLGWMGAAFVLLLFICDRIWEER